MPRLSHNQAIQDKKIYKIELDYSLIKEMKIKPVKLAKIFVKR